TEDVVLSDLELASHRMNQLRDLDVQFSLDDFGTGNSSFNFLRYLPVSELKVDRSFVRRFLYDQQDRAIVESILSLARSLELRVVAEGVETHLQHQELLAMGCSFFQGYLFDRPMTERQNPLPTRLASVAPLS
ncbi:MAG: EAL domain-containing protein, partial [Prochlorococcaceae cyanobacterium]